MELRQRSKILVRRIFEAKDELKNIQLRRKTLIKYLQNLHDEEETILNPACNSLSSMFYTSGTHADRTARSLDKLEKSEIKARCKTIENSILVIMNQEQELRRLLFIEEMVGGVLSSSYNIFKQKEAGLSYDNIAAESKKAKTTIIDIVNCYGDVICVLFESSLSENEINKINMESLEQLLDKELFEKILKYEI